MEHEGGKGDQTTQAMEPQAALERLARNGKERTKGRCTGDLALHEEILRESLARHCGRNVLVLVLLLELIERPVL